MSIELSEYQKDIINGFKTTNDNMFIKALAGTGKTFILVELSKYIKTYSLFIAFNKSIQEELKKRIVNEKFKTYTFNGLGYSIMRSNWEREQKEKKDKIQITIDAKKIINIVSGLLIDYPEYRMLNFEDQFKKCSTISTLYDLCRQRAIGMDNLEEISNVIYAYRLEIDPFDMTTVSSILAQTLKIDFEQFETQGIADFIDQLYITYIKILQKKWIVDPWYTFQNIMVDEAQDLSKLQQLFIAVLRRKNARLIFCGDYFQSIYSFAGADCNSVYNIKRMYKTVEYDLPINYRCPTSHLEYINNTFSIPILPCPNAIKGKIHYIDYEDIIKYIKPGDCILARKNKDLCKISLELLRKGLPIYIKDQKLLDNLNQVILNTKKDIKDFSLLKQHLKKLKKERQELLKKQTESFVKCENTEELDAQIENNKPLSDGVVDLLDCVEIIFKAFSEDKAISESRKNSWGEFSQYISDKLKSKNKSSAVQCVSVHLAKGQEYDRVFILQDNRIYYELASSQDQKTQERNLAYIAGTRSKSELYLCSEPADEED